MSQLMPQKEFFAALEAARQPKHGGGHAFSRSWAAGELSRQSEHLGAEVARFLATVRAA